ncbi:MAG: helix-turn-helix transcriptional regulator [Litorimonas sp.]
MARMIIIYGLILTLVAFGLTWLDYRFWMRDIGPEVYGIAIAVLFAALGVWIERQRNIQTPESETGRNERAIKALGLTMRELEVLECLRRGESNKQIARSLEISPNTVKTHLTNLYEKLGARNRTQAVTEAGKLSIYEVI